MITRPSIKKIECPLDPVRFYSAFADRPDTALLHSSMRTDAGRYSFIGLDPFMVVTSRGGVVEVSGDAGMEISGKGPFEALRKVLDVCRYANDTPLPFVAGGIGYFSYDLKNMTEDLPQKAVDELDTPDARFAFYRTLVIFDAAHPGSVTVSSIDAGSRRAQDPEELVGSAIADPGAGPRPGSGTYSADPDITSNFSKDGYIEAVGEALEHIRQGDIYQLCLTQRFRTRWPDSPYRLYEKLSGINPSPFSAYLNFGDHRIISSSPELFLRRRGDIIETRPMKGTRPRGRSGGDDARIKEELRKSQKDTSELLMIVDLERNDLGKTAVPGTVEVVEHRRIETYPTVFQTIAVIRSRVPEDTNNIDIIRSVFPGGSITGCPKIRAMEIIDSLEPTARGVYTGSIGYLSFHGDMDLNIAIRTMVYKDGEVFFQAGGGIVSDSEPMAEYEESLVKARALVESLGAREHSAQAVHDLP